MNPRAGLSLSDQAMAAIASARRAVAVERWSDVTLTTELRPLAALADITEPWKILAAQALEANVFLDPAFARAAARPLGGDVQALLIWSKSSRELLGLFPMRVERARYGLPYPVLSAWTHPYAPFGTPLVCRDAAGPAIDAWLDRIAGDPSLPKALLLPYVNENGSFAATLLSILSQRRNRMASFDRHRRALLVPDDRRADYLKRAIAYKRRHELTRKWRRMEDLGAVEVVSASEPAEVANAMEHFFRIEAAGWKGRVGTAAMTDPSIRGFMLQAVLDLAATGQAIVRRLQVAERTIAVAVALRSQQSVWGWKVAYDEAYARFSPGVQILIRLTQDLLADASIVQVDSTATANHPMIDHIWRERRIMVDWLIEVRPHPVVPFAFVSWAEAARRAGRQAGKAVRKRLWDYQRANKVKHAPAISGE